MDYSDIYAGLKRTVPPVAEPVTLADMKNFLRVPAGFTDDDSYISTLITIARQVAEETTRRSFVAQTWKYSMRNWPGRNYQNWPVSLTSELDIYYKYNFIALPQAAPLQPSESMPNAAVPTLSYMDSSGVVRTMTYANFTVLPGFTFNIGIDFEPGRIFLPFSQIWPTDILMPGQPITITYIAGYPDVPTFLSLFEGSGSVVMTIKMMAGYLYENRIPPSEMRRSSIDAGLRYVVDQLLSLYTIH